MYFIIVLLIFALSTRAQSNLTFTGAPTTAIVGKPTMLKWKGGDNSVRNLIYMRVVS